MSGGMPLYLSKSFSIMPRINGTPKVRFNLFDKKAESTYIFAYFVYRGHRLKYSSGEKCRTAFWDAKRQRLHLDKRHPEHTDINLNLNKLEMTILDIYRDFSNGDIQTDDFRNEIGYRLGYVPRPETIIEQAKAAQPLFVFIERYIEGKKGQPRGTWKILLAVFSLLKTYAKERERTPNYEDINVMFFNDFKNWLFAPPREHSINYAAKVFAVLRQFMRAAQDENLHTNTSYLDKKFKITKIKTSKFVLAFSELEALHNMNLEDNPRLERVRDLFLIGAYTGLRFSDFTRITANHIEETEGKTIINITTQKTGAMVSIPLLPIPLALLKKYNFRAPAISNQKMNDYLKELGQLAGMTEKMIVTGSKAGKRQDTNLQKWERLTTHVARRSFATNFYRDGVPAVVLMQITGHTTQQQFMQYIAIDGKENALHFADLRKADSI
jgi:integrase